jgi:hypothetical protein
VRFPAAVAVGLLLAAAGCAAPRDGAGPTPGPDPDGEETHPPATSADATPSGTGGAPVSGPDSAVMVRLHRWVWVNRTSGDQTPYGEFGHHCGGGTWTEEPPTVRVHEWPESYSATPTSRPDPWATSGILVMTYEPPQEPSFSRVGSGPTLHAFDAVDGGIAIGAVFSQSGPVANLTADGGSLRVEGAALATATPVTVDRTYAFTQAGSSYEAHERLRFTLVGQAEVWVEHKPYPCI